MLIGIFSALLAGLLVQASGGLQLPEQYIDCPRKGIIESGSLDRYLFKGPNLSPEMSPEMVMAELKRQFQWQGQRIPTHGFKSRVGWEEPRRTHGDKQADFIQDLGDGRRQCSQYLASHYIRKYLAYKTTKKAEEHPEVMLNFLDYYGRRKFPACASKAIAEISITLSNWSEYYAKPVEFFKTVFSLGGKASDVEFYNELKQFKPLDSAINIDYLKKLFGLKTGNGSTVGRIKKEFDSMCSIVNGLQSEEMNTLVLADHFDPTKKYFEKNPKIGVMKELKRACSEMMRNGALLERLKDLCKPEDC